MVLHVFHSDNAYRGLSQRLPRSTTAIPIHASGEISTLKWCGHRAQLRPGIAAKPYGLKQSRAVRRTNELDRSPWEVPRGRIL
jgi:hypothetical protein